jgi:hypothetical protein
MPAQAEGLGKLIAIETQALKGNAVNDFFQ